jgi:RNA polymerase sigma-70 factor (ECF subfamily)
MEANTNAAHAGALAAEKRLPLHDPVRMDALIRRLEPRLSAVALGVTRDPDAARDVVQNAFVKVLRHGDKFRGQARVSTWLHRIVTNEALMWRRSQSRRREDPLDDHGERADGLASASRSPADLAEWRQQVERLREGLAALPREEREVLHGCALEGQTYSEYGRRHGLHPAAVKSRAFRARRRLAVALEK